MNTASFSLYSPSIWSFTENDRANLELVGQRKSQPYLDDVEEIEHLLTTLPLNDSDAESSSQSHMGEKELTPSPLSGISTDSFKEWLHILWQAIPKEEAPSLERAVDAIFEEKSDSENQQGSCMSKEGNYPHRVSVFFQSQEKERAKNVAKTFDFAIGSVNRTLISCHEMQRSDSLDLSNQKSSQL